MAGLRDENPNFGFINIFSVLFDFLFSKYKIFPLKRRNPLSSNLNACMIFNSEGSNLSIEPVKNCSL